MDAITHLLVGRLLAAGLGPDAAALGWLATAFAVLPDADTVSWAFPRLRRFVRHRGITHTLPFGVAASLAAGALFALAGWAPFAAAFAVAMAGFLSHVALDVLNWGAPVLWPWRRRPVEWTLHAGFVWSAVVSASGLVLLAAAHAARPGAVPLLAALMAAGLLGHLGVRAAAKLAWARRHPGRRLVPTAHPLVWRVIERAR